MIFLFLFMLFLCNIANVAQRTFGIIQKSRSREHGDIINYRTSNVRRLRVRENPETSMIHVRGTHDVSRKLQPTLCEITAS